ncbi:MAG: type II toxin-antitoxin system RelE/ParE family toxin [Candidatus Omnitrophota bacterium]
MANIYEEIAKDSPIYAERFVDDLVRQIYKLAHIRMAGAPRDWIRPGLRAFPYRKRCFYFRIEGEKLILLRVLHGAQDIENQFGEEYR